MTEHQITVMVNRFLQWKLPENFNPDNGISFERTQTHPVGTNLFDWFQTREMIMYITEGL